ncbi:hypothetical protein Moror_7085 [Moniliophthora roreri MCA 2997]|uniref:CID domain-containing protein n=2 Tax=Moniliophthora roreri TaxID=221103 RepID=V2YX71_MONRO|nr:hypothetical protein Moror_7085 [Moniliophthora roreri MCA 2997]KAI3608452.1 hypothetical protein WG66_001000 [Moniliophthora roreri]
MDPFEVRMNFLGLLRRLNASQQSIQKVVTFAVKHHPQCGEDLWDCIVEECQKGSINSRINILYFLDSLCETCLLVKTHSEASNTNLYVDYVSRDLPKIVENVVPEGREGLPNLVSTRQILESWRTKRVIDPQVIEAVLSVLESRKVQIQANDPGAEKDAPFVRDKKQPSSRLPRQEVFRRIEEDRERHKRLRERRWVQPITHNPATQMQMPGLTSFLPLTEKGDGEFELSIDIEFENEWETLSDWNEDDDEACAEENALCYPPEDLESRKKRRLDNS